MIDIHIEVDEKTGSVNTDISRSILHSVLTAQNVKEANITIIFGSDELLSKLKKEFFHVNQLTDVIAFRLNEYEEEMIEGEIYISIPRAHENSNQFNTALEEEIARLIIHGGLHLLNYDDSTDEQKKVMRGLEDNYLSQVDWINIEVIVK